MNPVRRLVAGLALPLAAVALTAAGLLIPVPGGISSLAAVTAGLIAAWALCGAATAWARERTPQWQQAAGAVAAAAQRIVRMLDGRILAPEAQDEPQSQPQREASVTIEAR